MATGGMRSRRSGKRSAAELGIADADPTGMRKYMFLIVLLASCSNNNNNDREQRASDAGAARGGDLVTQAQGNFNGSSDQDDMAKAASIVSTINTGEIAQANLVLSLNVASDVRDLANEIVADHQANETKLQAMMQNASITVMDNPVSTSLRTEAMAGLAKLQSDAQTNLDADYPEMQVMMHQEAFVVVGGLRDLVVNEAFRQFLTDTQNTIQQHRNHAGTVLGSHD
jgi:putative membrane protein